MKIPFDAEIAREKITKYLLTKRDESDKSLYLTTAGYTIDEYEQLVEDLRNQILLFDATLIELTEFGDKYEINGVLKSPSGKELSIKTIWMKEHATEKWKFITLFPVRRRGE